MSDLHFQTAYEKQNRRDQIAYSKVASVLSVILNLFCSLMDHYVYPDKWLPFFKARLLSVLIVVLTYFWFQSPNGRKHHRIFGVIWYASPLIIILWMIYHANDALSPYYAGLNIVLLAVGLLSPWTYIQNLVSAVIVILLYVLVCYWMPIQQSPISIYGNTTFLLLTAAIVVAGSVANARQRLREFTLRFQLDTNKRTLEETNRNLEVFNTRLAEQNAALDRANREIKEAEAQLVQSEKMASLGRFSAGLMHDILNPLNYAKTGLYTLQKKSRKLTPEQRTDFEGILTDVKDGVDRVQEIVQSLRNFSHPGEHAPERVELTAMLNDVGRFVAAGLKEKNIALNFQLSPAPIVWIGRNDFSVMLINLLENSIDAMNGKVFAPEEQPAITVSSHADGGRTIITIRDNGSGIDQKIIAKIFDPFFTTKDVGKGTGLGLSLCFGMIRNYGGTIGVTSELGQYTEFTLNLPANAEAAAQTKLLHAEPIRL